MSISDSKIRCSLVIDKKDKTILESMAKKDDRSVNYIINQAIKEFIKKNLPDKEEWQYKRQGFNALPVLINSCSILEINLNVFPCR